MTLSLPISRFSIIDQSLKQVNAHHTMCGVYLQDDRRDGRQEDLFSGFISYHIHIVRTCFDDLHQFVLGFIDPGALHTSDFILA